VKIEAIPKPAMYNQLCYKKEVKIKIYIQGIWGRGGGEKVCYNCLNGSVRTAGWLVPSTVLEIIINRRTEYNLDF
jgi:hypothetical protein